MTWRAADAFFAYDGDHGQPTTPSGAVFLSGCDDDEWDRLSNHLVRTRHGTGSAVRSEGDTDRVLTIVLQGEVEVLRRTGRRRTERVAILGPGAIVGEQGFLDGAPADATVRALSDIEVAQLSLERFELLAAADPNLALYVLFDLARVISTQLRAARMLR